MTHQKILFYILLFSLICCAHTANCPNGQFSNITYMCQVCPIQCQTCSQPTFNNVICLSCPANSYRAIDNASKCSCVGNYIETFPIQKYCCHKYCLTCNQTSCIECALYTNRIVDNKTGLCVCREGFVETQNKIVCSCEIQNYYYLDSCFPCPLNCGTCEYVLNITCKTCPLNSNRNSSQIDCLCNQYFTQTTPYISVFCYAINCVLQQANCTACNQPTILRDGICDCRTGYFLNSSNVCEQCQMPGCLDCKGQIICLQCDNLLDYYLVQDVCAEVNTWNFITTYDDNGDTVLQFDYQDRLPSPFNISTEVDLILHQNPEIIPPPLNFNIIKYQISYNRILTVWFSWNDIQTYVTDQVMFLFEFDYLENQSLPFNITSVRKNIKVDRLYPPTLMDGLKSAHAEHVLCLLSVLCAMVGYVYGYKHNQITFYIQTLCLMGYSLQDVSKESIIFLNNLRYSYYQFTNDNPFSSYPEIYIKRAYGNYNFLCTDDSYFRIFGWAFLFTMLNLLLFVIYVIFNFLLTKYYNSKNSKKGLIKYFHYRKYFLRVMEYFYLTTMYPLIFGSLQTFKNWDGLTLVSFDSIAYFNKVVSVLTILMYVGITLYTWFISRISEMSKIINVMQIVSYFIASIIIINCVYTHWIILIVIVPISKNLGYMFIRTHFVGEQVKIIKLLWIVIILESITIIITALNYFVPMVVLVCITVTSQITFVTLIIGFYYYEKYRGKLSIRQLQKSVEGYQEDIEESLEDAKPKNLKNEGIVRVEQVAKSNQVMMEAAKQVNYQELQ